MKSVLSALVVALTVLVSSSTSQADIQPAELVAGSINLTGSYVVAEIYVGGTYGQTYPGGRRATLEVKEGSGAYRTLWTGVLPNIGTEHSYITRPYASPVKVATTFRLSISGSDRNPGNDVNTRTFRPSFSAFDAVIRDTIVPKTKLRAEDMIRITDSPFKKKK